MTGFTVVLYNCFSSSKFLFLFILEINIAFNNLSVIADRSVFISHCLGLQLRVRTRKIIFLFLNQNISCGYSKEPSQ